eukprot:CAMPEP_0178405430 /NCGR_PEP_ID=MMETSP0689_2-20121128/18395_1 /TAXON_ID=160604 /ORGANISM="Amphidinium massartii, Strain CS-259" /LENGTH=1223 /DNA_ID=CAMNT_0020026445 /DNA_START=71 /DNA_END=3742 /DNA_ORIENTATION=-
MARPYTCELESEPETVLAVLEAWLVDVGKANDNGQLHDDSDSKDGFYGLQDALDSLPQLRGMTLGRAVCLLATAPAWSPIKGDDSGNWIKLRSLEERVQGVVEDEYVISAGSEGVMLTDLLELSTAKEGLLDAARESEAERLTLLTEIVESSARIGLDYTTQKAVPLEAATTTRRLLTAVTLESCMIEAAASSSDDLAETRAPSAAASSSGGDFGVIGSGAFPPAAFDASGWSSPGNPWLLCSDQFAGYAHPAGRGRDAHRDMLRGRSLSPGALSWHAPVWDVGTIGITSVARRARSCSPRTRAYHSEQHGGPPRQKAVVCRAWKICSKVCDLLKTSTLPKAADGSVSALSLFQAADYETRRECMGSVQYFMRQISGLPSSSAHESHLVADSVNMRVRLATRTEQLVSALEEIMLSSEGFWPGWPQRLKSLRFTPKIRQLFGRQWDADDEDKVDSHGQYRLLKEAVETSQLLELVANEDGYEFVQVRSTYDLLRDEMESVLQTNSKAVAMFKHEQEVPLAWVLTQQRVVDLLSRLEMDDRSEAMEDLRTAIVGSAKFELDTAGMSVRKKHSLLAGRLPLPQVDEQHYEADSSTAPNDSGDEAESEARMSSPVAKAFTTTSTVPAERWQTMRRQDRIAMLLNEEHKKAPKRSSHWERGATGETWGRRHQKNSCWEAPCRYADVKKLRELLDFYFQSFNLQHNRLLMALVQGHRDAMLAREEDEEQAFWKRAPHTSRRRPHAHAAPRRGYLQSTGRRPIFTLEDMKLLPRIAHMLAHHDNNDDTWRLFREALEDSSWKRCLRVRDRQSVWADRRAEPTFEMTYLPELRFIEVAAGASHRPEVQALTRPTDDPCEPMRKLPDNVLSVVSYTISSDLSNPASPKAEKLKDEMWPKELEAASAWPVRMQKIRRQVLLYNPDIICLQGIQSIDFQDRCSEWDDGWFQIDPVHEQNHLVHLYRELCTKNYGVAWAPIMHVPDCARVALGNAIFWRRSRWQLDAIDHVMPSAACVQLLSRSSNTRIVVASCKSAATLCRDWGDFTEDDVAGHFEMLHTCEASLVRRAAKIGALALWCGDLGGSSDWLKKGLAPLRLQSAAVQDSVHGDQLMRWRSATKAILKDEPWSMALKDSNGVNSNITTDLILHSPGMQGLAALGGFELEYKKLSHLLRDGYPSDHLMQCAVLEYRSAGSPVCSDDEASSSDSDGLQAPLQGAWAQPRAKTSESTRFQ